MRELARPTIVGGEEARGENPEGKAKCGLNAGIQDDIQRASQQLVAAHQTQDDGNLPCLLNAGLTS